MVMEFGKEFMETRILENGKITNQMDLVSISGEMVIVMKENGSFA